MRPCGCTPTPIRIEDDEQGGERYECYYCKAKWRYIHVYPTLCPSCENHGLQEGATIKCRYCNAIYTEPYTSIRRLAFW